MGNGVSITASVGTDVGLGASGTVGESVSTSAGVGANVGTEVSVVAEIDGFSDGIDDGWADTLDDSGLVHEPFKIQARLPCKVAGLNPLPCPQYPVFGHSRH